MRNVNDAEFAEVTSGAGVVLVDFWASWCGPCRVFTPILEKVAEAHPEVTLVGVNVEEQRELAQRCGITSIPTLWVFSGGEQVGAVVGVVPQSRLERMVQAVVAAR